MTCKFCGNEIEEGASFCFICGQPVEVEAPVAEAPVAETPTPAPVAEPVYAEQPVAPQPEYVQPQPAYVQPEYTQPVAYTQPAPVAETGKKGKKAKKQKDPNAANKFVLVICFLFAIIGSIIYRKAVKAGNETKRVQIANAIFLGLDIKLAILILVLGKKWML